jgi:UDP-glucose 4-epimerase
MQKKKVFITGGAGFIGQAVAKVFAKAGYRVKTFDLFSPAETIGEHVTGTIMFPEELFNAMKGSDYVVHLAAMLGVKRTEEERLKCLNVNIVGTMNVLEAAVKAGVKKIVFASSSEVYGEPIRTPLSETDIVFPKSVYAVSKLAGEEYIRAYKQTHGLDFSIVRFFNVYGPGQVAEFVMPNFIKAALAGNPIPINGDGTQVRSFCYVDDAARGVLLSLKSKKANGEVFNIGNDTAAISLKDLAHKVLTHAGKDKKHIVHLKEHQADRLHSREIKTRTADITKARKTLKYKPLMHLDEGIKRIIKSKNASDFKVF